MQLEKWDRVKPWVSLILDRHRTHNIHPKKLFHLELLVHEYTFSLVLYSPDLFLSLFIHPNGLSEMCLNSSEAVDVRGHLRPCKSMSRTLQMTTTQTFTMRHGRCAWKIKMPLLWSSVFGTWALNTVSVFGFFLKGYHWEGLLT